MEKLFRIYNMQGLHMRPAAQIATIAQEFEGRVYFYFDNKKANAKNILELMFLSLNENDEFKVIIESNSGNYEQENEMYQKLLKLIEIDKFGEY